MGLWWIAIWTAVRSNKVDESRLKLEKRLIGSKLLLSCKHSQSTLRYLQSHLKNNLRTCIQFLDFVVCIGNRQMDLLLERKQDSGLQSVVLDRVHGAGRMGTVLVAGAGVVHMAAAHTPGQDFFAIRAAEEAAEQMNQQPLGGCAGVPISNHLSTLLRSGGPCSS